MVKRKKGMFQNADELPKWNDEDLKKAEGCRWMKDRQYNENPDMNFIQRIREFYFWYTKLYENLPTPELYAFKEKTKDLSIVFNHRMFISKIKFARYDMVYKLGAYDYHKAKVIDASSKAYEENTNNNTYKAISDEIRDARLVQQFPDNTPLQKKQMDVKVEGYVPCEKYLVKLPPMEVIEYCGFKLIKYDKWHGYYSAMLVFPKGDRKRPRVDVFYNEDSNKLELIAETYFNKYLQEYLEQFPNPYGNKEFVDIDISHVKKSLSDPTSDPLNKDIF